MSDPEPPTPALEDVPLQGAPTEVGPVDTPGDGPVSPSKSGRNRFLKEWGVIVVIAVAAAIVLRLFLIEPFFIPSGSMEPTLMVHDRVLVDRLSYHLHGVHRGDIIVFARPADDNEPSIKDLVKRVIGLPGETISSGSNGTVYINGKAIKQPWLTASAKASPGPDIAMQKIPPGEYFVMGDNRGNSEDSRYFGPISGKLIVGRAFLRVWPLSRIGTL